MKCDKEEEVQSRRRVSILDLAITSQASDVYPYASLCLPSSEEETHKAHCMYRHVLVSQLWGKRKRSSHGRESRIFPADHGRCLEFFWAIEVLWRTSGRQRRQETYEGTSRTLESAERTAHQKLLSNFLDCTARKCYKEEKSASRDVYIPASVILAKTRISLFYVL